jgi:hypothetical protein
VIGAIIAIAIAVSAVTAAAAGSPGGSEFDRITADLRAAIQRHDPRSYHLYVAQLEALIDEATAG